MMDNATFRESMNAVAVAASKVSAQEPGIHDLLACLGDLAKENRGLSYQIRDNLFGLIPTEGNSCEKTIGCAKDAVVLSFVVSLGLAIYVEKRFGAYSWLFLVIAFLSFLVSIIMLVVIIVNNTNVDSYVAENQMRYEMLVYQYENDIYDNDNDLGKRELMEDIQKWNEDLAYRRKSQDDFWVGIFYPNVHDQFEFIELK